MGFRNLRRHGRRTMLTSSCVAAAVAAMVFFMGYYRGTYDLMFYGAIIDYQTAHVQFQSPFLDPEDPSGWAGPRSLVAGWEGAVAAARKVPRVSGVAPRLELPCFAGDGTERLPAMLAGVDFASEKDVSVFVNRVSRGALPAAPGGALVGAGIARMFDLGPGDSIVLHTTTSAGAPNIGRFSVSGVFESGFALLDSSLVAVSLADAGVLADAPGSVNRIYVKLASMRAVDGAMAALSGAASLAGAEARPWTRYASAALSHAKSETVFYYIFLAILVLVSASAIASTMRVAVYERVREIGTLRATGWARGDVFMLFVVESAAVGLVGALAGAVLGGGLSALLAAFPVDVSALSGAIDYPFFAMTSSSRPGDFLLAAAVGVGASMAAGIPPARRAARTNIVKALSTH